ncbi:hypothetical protein ACFQV2_08330 [Actinokineospora soli]|uniref:Uncharacterized protein n=1 Tax=Actinokineospora soli TaxID=1048753 RepID=A0ABW2TIQ5_9PSEU
MTAPADVLAALRPASADLRAAARAAAVVLVEGPDLAVAVGSA